MNRLDRIVESTRKRMAEQESRKPLGKIREEAEKKGVYKGPSFFEALRGEGMSMICEVKRASPSKGVIAPDFPYLKIAKAYERGGAAAISCLTEPFYFQGSDRYLEEIAKSVSLPILRKDFIISPYMIYEARLMGAAAVLLICAILTDEELSAFLGLAHSLGLSVLAETHTEEEVRRAARAGARIIGINNRDLTSFTVDLGTSERLAALVPEGAIWVSESGIHHHEDVKRCAGWGASGILVGERLMRDPDPEKAVRRLLYGED